MTLLENDRIGDIAESIVSMLKTNYFRTVLDRYHKAEATTVLDAESLTASNPLEGLKRLALVDVSKVYRVGFKGKDTPDWLAKQEVTLPEKPNRSLKLDDGTLIARLSSNEFLLLDAFGHSDALSQKLYQTWQSQKGVLCFPLLRAHSHCWLLLSGNYAEGVLSKLCGVNFQEDSFPYQGVAQTSLARLSSIIIKDSLADNTPIFHLLSDSTSAEYLWHSIVDAMQEFSGEKFILDC